MKYIVTEEEKMDTIKIGKFLAELRHEHNMTQEQLGEKLGVTNKTISRWENGNYMPPVDVLLMLSGLYGISINEILSGRRLEEAEFKQEAEVNLANMLSESAFSLKDRIQFFKRKWVKEHAFFLILEILALLTILIVGFVLDNGLQIVAIIAGIICYIINYNQMMIFVEAYAFGKHGDKG